LKEGKQPPPIVLNSSGKIIDGTHRVKAFQNLKIPTILAYVPQKGVSKKSQLNPSTGEIYVHKSFELYKEFK